MTPLSPSIDTAQARSALDARGLDALKRQSRESPDKALVTAAKQFEAIFTQMLLKSMRDAVPESGLTGGNESKLYTSMFDQELAQKMASSGRGLGIADMIVKQLSRGAAPSDVKPLESGEFKPLVTGDDGLPQPTAPLRPRAPDAPTPISVNVPTNTRDWLARLSAANTDAGAGGVNGAGGNQAQAFVDRMLPHAQAAERTTGLPAHFILGQAALESGWGQREIRGAVWRVEFCAFKNTATDKWLRRGRAGAAGKPDSDGAGRFGCDC